MILLLQVAAGIVATTRKSKVCTHIIPDSFGKVWKIDMLPPGMNHLTALFNFQTEQALNKTLLINARLLSSTDENERVFQKAFSELQEEVIRTCGLSGELDIVLLLLSFWQLCSLRIGKISLFCIFWPIILSLCNRKNLGLFLIFSPASYEVLRQFRTDIKRICLQ